MRAEFCIDMQYCDQLLNISLFKESHGSLSN